MSRRDRAGSPVGKTKDAGWQIGVSRTIAVDVADVPFVKGAPYETVDGTIGEVRSIRPGDRVRLTWQPADRADPATVQVALSPAKTGCALRFHAERFHDADEREAMRAHYQSGSSSSSLR